MAARWGQGQGPLPGPLLRRGLGPGRRRAPWLLVACGFAAALLALAWPRGGAGLAYSDAARRHAEEVLVESALLAFKDELPHKWHHTMDKVLQPVAKVLPDLAGSMHLAGLRRDFGLPGSGIVLVESHGRGAYGHWMAMLQEVCQVLGIDQAPPSTDELGAPMNSGVATKVLCPELWVDEAWPPTPLAPSVGASLGLGGALLGASLGGAFARAGGAATPPVWSVVAAPGGRGLIVAQAKLLCDYPSAEVKALFGYELGKAAWGRLAPIPTELAEKLAQAFLVNRAHHAWQRGQDLQLHATTHPLERLFPPLQPPPHSLSQLFPGRNAAELGALALVINRIVPPLLQPLVFGGAITHRHQVHDAFRSLGGWGQGPAAAQGQGRHGHGRELPSSPLAWLRPRPPPTLAEKAAPWAQLCGEVASVYILAILRGTRSRSVALTLDRVAALAAGDAHAAAAALLRAQGMLPAGAVASKRVRVDEVLEAISARASLQEWDSRREAVLRNPREPRPEVRVRALLRWGETEAGERLMALAEMRRRSSLGRWLHMGFSFRFGRWPSGGFLGEGGERGWGWLCALGRPLLGPPLLSLLLALPFFTRIDAVRWASICTLALTACGVLAGISGGASLPLALRLPLLGALLAYSACVSSIWWNHLLGGSRRWAEVSTQLADRLSDQADITAGIAFLAKEWADMARRSMAALDQELMGSWRMSLHELASKLKDLRQEVEAAEGGLRVWPPPLSSASSSALTAASQRASAAGSRAAVPLWRKVDHAVQRAAQVETARMKQAMDETDPQQLHAMMTWWLQADPAASAAGSAAGAKILSDAAPPAGASFGQAEGDTLGALYLSDKLHQRFPYTSFVTEDHNSLHFLRHDTADAAADMGGGDEFRRLEQALAQNLVAFQELRSRIAPWAQSRAKLWGSWADVYAVSGRLQQVLHWPLRVRAAPSVAAARAALAAGLSLPSDGEDPKDHLSELQTLSCLFLSSAIGLLITILAFVRMRWCWVLCSAGFFVCNLVLLLNYPRLYLPHVRRRLDRRLTDLSQQRETLENETRVAQRSHQRAGLVHVRACICLQSVNVLRNVNYLALCVKTEVQRAGATSRASARQGRAQIAACGLQLLLALLPHTDPQWRSEALLTESSGSISAAQMLYGRLPGVDRAFMREGISEAQKRLWILFRMVHLSSAIPEEVQGQLGGLVERYLRPVLLERRVPLGSARPALQLHSGQASSQAHAALHDAAGKQGDSALHAAAAKRRQEPDVGLEDDRLSTFYAESGSASSVGRSSKGEDCTGALRKLAATRGDIARVLSRLPKDVLVGLGAPSAAAEGVLGDMFASVIVLIAAGTKLGDKDSFDRPVVGLASGYSMGTPYTFESIETGVLLRVVTPRKNASGTREASIPLTALLDVEPDPQDAVMTWSALCEASPARYGDGSLKVRRRALRRAKDSLRALRRTDAV